MRLASEVSADKLRGGFYSPQELVRACLDRIAELTGGKSGLSVLEPSAGDGAFVRGIEAHSLATKVSSLTAVEVVPSVASECEQRSAGAPFDVRVLATSFLSNQVALRPTFDVVVGNPPFVRYQFIDKSMRADAEAAMAALGVPLAGVSNLWLPIVLKSLACLKLGGAFALIVPAECLTGASASVVRAWLLSNTTSLRIDLFPSGSFPGVLQEIVVLSGVRQRPGDPGASTATFVEHHGSGDITWTHCVRSTDPTWTRYLLTPNHLDAYREVASLDECLVLGDVAKFGVATVTGANEFFSVDEETVRRYELGPWARPLLARVRNADGLVFDQEDFRRNVSAGLRSSILDFAEDRPDPLDFPRPGEYLRHGERLGLHRRYKCRIRDPWYRVPIVPAREMLLSKRSHLYPRLILNQAQAITTDTIYQGSMLGAGRAASLVASFHNSVTLLSAEIEGRSFGGGVLELVPSEVARLRVFVEDSLADELPRLDELARASGPDSVESLVEETDRRLAKAVRGLNDSLLAVIAEARRALQRRRLDRN
ncbi:MAG: N-6 DNA methylase [Micromonosporaceae bacterium]|nr:N-6 DNA methylase [Micromonosporaceae bacterium]